MRSGTDCSEKLMKSYASGRTGFGLGSCDQRLLWVICCLVFSGCTTSLMPISGLHPVYPPAEVRLNMFAGPPMSAFVEIDSLQPTFKWEPFHPVKWEPFRPRKDQAPDAPSAVSKPTDLTYELKIWRVKQGYPVRWRQGTQNVNPGELFYARQELRDTVHRVEQPLEPSTMYFWSVRAHFSMEGQPGTTEWAEQAVQIWWPFPNVVSYFGFKTTPQ